MIGGLVEFTDPLEVNRVMSEHFVERTELQNRLFSKLSAMFAEEVPLYDHSLHVNQICNRLVGDILAEAYLGFSIDELQLERTSGERHGAIRIGTAEEYRWIRRLFHCFGMEPHQFYDMSNVGAKSQPIVATAFRSREQPEHRIFCSLLLIDYFDRSTADRIREALSKRQVISQTGRSLIELAERNGGLDESDGRRLIDECVSRVFKWHGQAIDLPLYQELCAGGFKIAADIACFPSHHLNHLTPNTFCIDVYTSAMKYCLGEIPVEELVQRLNAGLIQMVAGCDPYQLRLLFRHLTISECLRFKRVPVNRIRIAELVDQVVAPLTLARHTMEPLLHSGFKDSTEGPPADTPVLLRQDAYKALAEAVVFTQADGGQADAMHTARFGEIEQRGYATTPIGRQLYDDCLQIADRHIEEWRRLGANETMLPSASVLAFSAFPKSLPELRRQGLVHVLYSPTEAGLSCKGRVARNDREEMIAAGLVQFEGLRYEDFLPVSAAGIFASNLNQYGTVSTAKERPTYERVDLEEILGCPIIDTSESYARLEEESWLQTLKALDCPTS